MKNRVQNNPSFSVLPIFRKKILNVWPLITDFQQLIKASLENSSKKGY
jgi:hypothetical protein